MSDDLFSSARWLSDPSYKGYFRSPIPELRDDKIGNVLQRWILLDKDQRKASVSKASREQRRILLCYSERMACLAVRERKSDHIFFGLLALGISEGAGDFREAMLIVPLHFDAARRNETDPIALFEKASALLPSEMAADHLRGFSKLPPAKQSIALMGYVAGSDDQGFRYERTW